MPAHHDDGHDDDDDDDDDGDDDDDDEDDGDDDDDGDNDDDDSDTDQGGSSKISQLKKSIETLIHIFLETTKQPDLCAAHSAQNLK